MDKKPYDNITGRKNKYRRCISLYNRSVIEK